jgi:hypothetical protein
MNLSSKVVLDMSVDIDGGIVLRDTSGTGAGSSRHADCGGFSRPHRSTAFSRSQSQRSIGTVPWPFDPPNRRYFTRSAIVLIAAFPDRTTPDLFGEFPLFVTFSLLCPDLIHC